MSVSSVTQEVSNYQYPCIWCQSDLDFIMYFSYLYIDNSIV
eukprot:SAG31_NODE_20688_length_567_cov_5.534188_1_plen_40_part_10